MRMVSRASMGTVIGQDPFGVRFRVGPRAVASVGSGAAARLAQCPASPPGAATAGTSGAAHVFAITQAICDYRTAQGITGPLYMGKDTHALSSPAQSSALEVLAANNVETIIQKIGRAHV